MHDETELRISLLEEEARIGKRVVERGGVTIKTRVESREELVEAVLRQDEVNVERIRIGRVVDAVPAVREEGDVLIVPVIEERLVVRTELVLKEEIRVQRRATSETVRMPVTLRTMQAEVERREAQAVSQASPTGGDQNG